MNRKHHSGTGLFMTELILVILIFSVSAACCLQIYEKAYQVTRRTQRLKLVLNETENIVQLLKAENGETKTAARIYAAAEETNPGQMVWETDLQADTAGGKHSEGIIFYYDREGKLCGRDEMDFYIRVHRSEAEGIVRAAIDGYSADGEEIYSLDAALFPKVKEE